MQDKLKQPQQEFSYKTPLPTTSITTCPQAPKKRSRTELEKENQNPSSADSKAEEKYTDCVKNLNPQFNAIARRTSLRSADKSRREQYTFWDTQVGSDQPSKKHSFLKMSHGTNK